MNVNLSYGRSHLPVEFPDDCTTVIEPTYVAGLPDQAGAVRDAVRDPVGTLPLRDLARPGQTVAVSICDVTRPMPSRTVLPVILTGMILAVIVPHNCYRQFNRFFTRCLPPRIRRRTGLVMLRWIGTLGCIVGGVALVLAYAALAFLLNVNVLQP